MNSESGREFGRYTIYEQIGHGAFATVYRAENSRLKTAVAIKLLDQEYFEHAETIANFKREAQTLASLNHPHIVRVRDLDEQNGWLFMAMEYMAGGDLIQWQERTGQRFSFRQIGQMVFDVATALDYAHQEKELVHGDVKPHNILLDEHGRVKLADFGLLQAIGRSSFISDERTKGTAHYISPEQAKGAAPGPASDQYALAVVAYELFTGHPPFQSATALAIYMQQIEAPPPPMNQSNPLVTEQIEQVVAKALAKDPQARYENCADFARALQHAVAVTENQQRQELLSEASAALAAYELGRARSAIDAARQIMPDDEPVQQLLQQLTVQEQANKSYQLARQSLAEAEEQAQKIRQTQPNHPDPKGVLANLLPTAPTPWQAWRQRWQLGLLIMSALALVALLSGLGGTFYTITAAGAAPRGTLVALVRTAAPTSTNTPTLTPLPIQSVVTQYNVHRVKLLKLLQVDSSVRSITFSSDGTLLASTSDDATVRLWDVETGTQSRQPLQASADTVWSVGFSPDGTVLASGSAADTIHLWDVKTGTQLGELLQGSTDTIWSVGFSPDGTLLASGFTDGTIRLWDVETEARWGRPLRGHANSVGVVTFSPDGKLLASGSHDSTIRLWNVGTGTQVGQPLRGHTNTVGDVIFSPDGQLLASASIDGTVRLWDVATQTQFGEPLQGHTHYVLSVTFSPDGQLLASASIDGTIRLWDVSTQTQFGEPLQIHFPVRSVAFSPDGKILASGSDNGAIRLWSLATE